MGEWDWLNLDLSYPVAGSGEGYGVLDPWSSPGGGWEGGYSEWELGLTNPQEMPYDNWSSGQSGGGGDWLGSALGALGQIGGFLGKNASWLGPAVSGLGSLAGGAVGAQASRDAAGAQTDALNRALELQTAQWLQQQANQAPWLEAGRQALPQLQQLAAQGGLPAFQPPGLRFAREDYDKFLPGSTPGWTPQAYQGPQAVQAGEYRYTPGQVPGAAQYRYTPGAVPTLSGQELLANDPGVALRLQEGRNALEASAAARGGALSGPALAALQRQGQELSSQEYGNAWQRASQQAQLREQWAQAASQLGFGQAMDETRMREQLAQQASAQNWQQALQGQQTAWQQGLTAEQWAQQQRQAYDRQRYEQMLQQNQLMYGRDISENQMQYERALAAYNSQLQQQGTQWNRLAGLAGLGQTAVGQLGTQGAAYGQQMGSLLGQLGNAQAGGTLGSGQSWLSALGNVGQAVQGGLANQQLLSALQSLNR
jgi:hypothetical protein